MTIRKLPSLVCFIEGKKTQARIYTVRAVIKVLCKIEADAISSATDFQEWPSTLINDQAKKINDRRAKKRAKK